MSVLVWLQCPNWGPCSRTLHPPSHPDHFLLGTQPEKARGSVETLDRQTGASVALSWPTHLPTVTFGQEPATQTRAAWIGSRGWPPGRAARCLRPQERRAPLLSSQRWIEEGWLCDFSKKLVQSQRMGTSVPWALFWTRLRPQSGAGVSWRQPCVEEVLARWPVGGAALAGQLMRAAAGLQPRRQGAQAWQGNKKGPRAWAPGTTFSTSYAKGRGEALASQQVDLGPQQPSLDP